MQKTTDSVFYNAEGYPDFTAGQAITNAERKLKGRKRRRKRNGSRIRKSILQ
jgi:hypothetical protein